MTQETKGKVLVDYDFLLKVCKKVDYQENVIKEFDARILAVEEYMKSRVRFDEHSNQLLRVLQNKPPFSNSGYGI